MRSNVGSADKIVRILIGIALLAVAVFAEGPLRWVGLIGVVPLLTSAFGYCPLYALLGVDTFPMAK